MIKNFDLTGWTCFSERRNSKSYVSDDKKWMVKFVGEVLDNDIESLEYDREATKKTLEAGVKTPKVGDIVELSNGDIGLIYEYIEGKKSIARAMSEDLGNIDYYAKRFARVSRDMHSKVCDIKKFESMKERTITQIKEKDILMEQQKERAIKEISGRYAKLSLVCFFELFKFLDIREGFRKTIVEAFDKEIP